MKNIKYIFDNGFTLIELLCVMAMMSVIMSAVGATYINYINSVAQESVKDSINADVNAVFKVLEQGAQMSGYGLPMRTRIASHNNCNVGDETFCKANTDRLFFADGSEVLRDITDNHEDDGSISATYLTYIANARNNPTTLGYRAQLAANLPGSTQTVSVVDLNINKGEENTTTPPYDDDFKNNTALIIGDNSRVEGHRINTVSSPVISLLANDPFSSQIYLASSSHSIVPAVAWYLRTDPSGKKYPDGTPVYWLYRNNEGVIPNVDNFQVQYGYDANNDGIQWADTVPPPSARIRPVAKPSPDPPEDPWIDDGWVASGVDGKTFDFSYLKVVKIIITVKYVYKKNTRTTSYQTIIRLRN